jgi:large subunit ribosomal protein L6
MSKIGKQLISVPQGVTVSWTPTEVTVIGPKGTITKTLALHGFTLSQTEGVLRVDPPERLDKRSRSLWGTLNAVIANMVRGVQQPFGKVLEFEGVGYRAEVSGTSLVLNMGFSHLVKIEIPAGLTVVAQKNQISVSGINIEEVGLFAALIRKVRPVEPYKGSGIRYKGEVVKKKAGKKLAGATA